MENILFFSAFHHFSSNGHEYGGQIGKVAGRLLPVRV